MNRIRRTIAGTAVGTLLTVGAVTLAAAPAEAGNRIPPERAVSQYEKRADLPTDGALQGLGLGGLADAVCNLLKGLLGSNESMGDSSGLGLPELP